MNVNYNPKPTIFFSENHYIILDHTFSINDKKGKPIPLQAWRGPVGSRRLRFPDFMTIGT